jgi:hypothetical protein
VTPVVKTIIFLAALLAATAVLGFAALEMFDVWFLEDRD